MTAKPRNRGITVVRNSDGANRLANLEHLAREAAAVVCKELNAGVRQTWRTSHLVRPARRRRLSGAQRADAQPLCQRKHGAPQREGRQRPSFIAVISMPRSGRAASWLSRGRKVQMLIKLLELKTKSAF